MPSYAIELYNIIINDPTKSECGLVTEHNATWVYSEDKLNYYQFNRMAIK